MSWLGPRMSFIIFIRGIQYSDVLMFQMFYGRFIEWQPGHCCRWCCNSGIPFLLLENWYSDTKIIFVLWQFYKKLKSAYKELLNPAAPTRGGTYLVSIDQVDVAKQKVCLPQVKLDSLMLHTEHHNNSLKKLFFMFTLL